MKKLIITALIALTIGTSAFANPTKVNHRVLHNFRTEFNGAENVSWKTGDEFAKASFIYEDKAVEAYYNYDGELIGTSKAYAFDKLPKTALELIAIKYPYPPYKLKECVEFTNADGEKNYFLSFEKKSETIVLGVSLNGQVSVYKNL